MTKIDMTKLKNDLEAVPNASGGGANCRVMTLAEQFPEAAATLREAIADTRHSAAAISKVLTKNGLTLSEGTVRKHRRGECGKCAAAA